MENSQTKKPFKKRSLSLYDWSSSNDISIKRRISANEEHLSFDDDNPSNVIIQSKLSDEPPCNNLNVSAELYFSNSSCSSRLNQQTQVCENRLTLDNSISRTNTSSSPRLKEQNQGEQVSETVLSENKFILDNSISRTIPESELPVKKLDTNYEASANENQQNRDTAVTEFYDDFESLLEVLRSSDENNVAASHCSAKEKDNDLSNVICSTRSSDTCIKNPKPSIVIDLTANDCAEDVIDLTSCDDNDLQVKHVIKRLSFPSHLANFISKHYKTTTFLSKIPKDVSLKAVSNGLEISASGESIGAAEQILTSAKWFQDQMKIDCPKASEHFNSDCWKDFTKVLEEENSCAISVEYANQSVETPQTDPDQLAVSDSTNSCPPSQPATGSAIDLSDTCNSFSNYQSCRMEETNGNSTSSVKYGNLNVTVCQGDITDDNSFAIVNGTTPNFDLSTGVISQSIVRKGGYEIITECSNSGFQPWLPLDIRVTKGHKLHCKVILHLVTPKTIDDYTRKILSVLDVANQLRVDSLAIPSLGTGGNNLDPTMASQCMALAFGQFSGNPSCNLKSVKVVVFDSTLFPIFLSNIVIAKEHLDFSYQQVMSLEEKTKQMVSTNKASIHLTSDRLECIAKAKERIAKHLENYISRRMVDNEMVLKVGDHDCIDVYEASIKHHVQVQYIEDEWKNFKQIDLVGLKDNVNSLYVYMRELWFELREAETLSKSVIWKWEIGQNNFVAFPIRVSAALERFFKQNSFSKYELRLHGKVLKISMALMVYEFEKFKGKILRECSSSDSADLPLEWAPMAGNSLLRINLDPSSFEYRDVLASFMQSITHIHKVYKIERIQNSSLYRQYALMRSHVTKHLVTKNPVERKLFHGTSEEDVHKICSFGFDRGFAGKNATAFGRGCYFAVRSSYSLGYSRKNVSGCRYMFLANVLTGDFAQGRSDLRAPPEKRSLSGQHLLFDSVVDNMTHPSMFVVFKDSSAYPSYLITFI